MSTWSAGACSRAGSSVRCTRKRPAEPPAISRTAWRWRLEALAIGLPDGLGLAGDVAQRARHFNELDAAVPRQRLLGRIADLHQMAGDAALGDSASQLSSSPADRGNRRTAPPSKTGTGGRTSEHVFAGRSASTNRRCGCSDERAWAGLNGLPSAETRSWARSASSPSARHSTHGPLALGCPSRGANGSPCPPRAGPEPQRVRGLPFVLADHHPLGARRFVPVDALGRIAEAVGPVLPEALARPGAAAAMHAHDHGRGDALRFDQQAAAARCDRSAARPVNSMGARRGAVTRCSDFSRSVTLSTVCPSARAREGERHAVLEHRIDQRQHIVERRARAGPRAAPWRGRPASAPGWRAGEGPRRRSGVDELVRIGPWPRGAHDLQDALRHLLADGDEPGQALGMHELGRR